LLTQGFEGGRAAAQGLITSTRESLKDEIIATTKIWIFVLANATSLAQILNQRNVITTANIFHDFMNGFNSVDDLVTFTNVGRGKELVDTKIKGWSPENLTHRSYGGNVRFLATVSVYHSRR
jgi:hypothetical protein